MKSEVIVTEEELPAEVLDAIRDGRKIEAIQRLQEAKGLGLANAKVLVEQAWRRHGPEKRIPTFADQPPYISNLFKSLAMVFFIIAAYYFYAVA